MAQYGLITCQEAINPLFGLITKSRPGWCFPNVQIHTHNGRPFLFHSYSEYCVEATLIRAKAKAKQLTKEPDVRWEERGYVNR